MEDLLEIALNEYGVEEVVGGQHNATIVNYFKDIGHSWVKNDETAWCSTFINWCAKKAGYEYTKKLNARSWLDIGEEIEKPQVGDIVIFWRGSRDSWKGHVAIFINYDEDDRHVNVLGGNQGNMVKITSYDKGRVLGFRRLKKI